MATKKSSQGMSVPNPPAPEAKRPQLNKSVLKKIGHSGVPFVKRKSCESSQHAESKKVENVLKTLNRSQEAIANEGRAMIENKPTTLDGAKKATAKEGHTMNSKGSNPKRSNPRNQTQKQMQQELKKAAVPTPVVQNRGPSMPPPLSETHPHLRPITQLRIYRERAARLQAEVEEMLAEEAKKSGE